MRACISVLKLKSENAVVAVSEKLDGSNICVSTDNFVASRRKLIAQTHVDNLASKRFCNQSLASLNGVLDNAVCLKNLLKNSYFSEPKLDFDVLLYGEWIQEGTASSRVDKFHYHPRKIEAGQMYTFGLGIVFKTILTESQKQIVETQLSALNWWFNFCEKDSKNQTVVQIFLNQSLFAVLNHLKIQTVPFLGEHQFLQAINNEFFVETLVEQKCKGFILTSQNTEILKWKPVCSVTEYTTQVYETLEQFVFAHPYEKTLSAGLKKICFNSTKTAAPAAVPTQILFHHLFYSAKSKFLNLADLLQAQTDKTKRKDIRKKYLTDMTEEMKNDAKESFSSANFEDISKFASDIVWQEWMNIEENMFEDDLDELINNVVF